MRIMSEGNVHDQFHELDRPTIRYILFFAILPITCTAILDYRIQELQFRGTEPKRSGSGTGTFKMSRAGTEPEFLNQIGSFRFKNK